jgi:hypothetical protein
MVGEICGKIEEMITKTIEIEGKECELALNLVVGSNLSGDKINSSFICRLVPVIETEDGRTLDQGKGISVQLSQEAKDEIFAVLNKYIK